MHDGGMYNLALTIATPYVDNYTLHMMGSIILSTYVRIVTVTKIRQKGKLKHARFLRTQDKVAVLYVIFNFVENVMHLQCIKFQFVVYLCLMLMKNIKCLEQ